MAIFAYVDSESHFIRANQWWTKKHAGQSLENARPHIRLNNEALETHSKEVLTFDAKGRVFWDALAVKPIVCAKRCVDSVADQILSRAVYFTSIAGDDDAVNNTRRLIRDVGLEPVVIKEPKSLADQRANLLQQQNVIEKAKGVDISLAVRMIEDAFSDNFRYCMLFTSDVDYLPAIETVRRKGKRVIVAGFENGLSRDSPLLFVPDVFVDLAHFMNYLPVA